MKRSERKRTAPRRGSTEGRLERYRLVRYMASCHYRRLHRRDRPSPTNTVCKVLVYALTAGLAAAGVWGVAREFWTGLW